MYAVFKSVSLSGQFLPVKTRWRVLLLGKRHVLVLGTCLMTAWVRGENNVRPAATAITNVSGYVTLVRNDVGGESSLDQTIHWSDGLVAHSGTNYLVQGNSRVDWFRPLTISRFGPGRRETRHSQEIRLRWTMELSSSKWRTTEESPFRRYMPTDAIS